MNLMLYAKGPDEKRFGAVDLAHGAIGVGLAYATIVPEEKLEVLKSRANTLHLHDPAYTVQIRYAGTQKVLYEVMGRKTE